MSQKMPQKTDSKSPNVINLSDQSCKMALAFEYLTITTIVVNSFIFLA